MRKRSPHDWTDFDFGALTGGDPSQLIAVLPLGATEQHGPHLPLGTDVMIGEAYLARVRELLPEAAPVRFLPMQPVGVSAEHVAFPGTLTLPAEVAMQGWTALGDSVARAGVRKLVMVTSHGGNSSAMDLVARDLRIRHEMLVVTVSWSRFGVPGGLFTDEEVRHGVHGGAIETAIMLAAWPDQVRSDRIANFTPSSVAMESRFKWLSAHRPAPFAWAAQDLHKSGAAGDATQATADKGRLLLDHGARSFCELLTDVQTFDLKQL